MGVNKKAKLYQVLKTISYLAGLPLFVMVVLFDSMVYFGEGAFEETLWNGLYIALAVWAFISLVQIGLSLLVKSRDKRVATVIVIALIAMLLPTWIIDSHYTKELDGIRVEAEKVGAEVENYKYLAGYTNVTSLRTSIAEDFCDDVDAFNMIYNIGDFEGEAKGRNLGNEPLTDPVSGKILTNEKGETVFKYDESLEKADDPTEGFYGLAWYSPNGMLYDGYIFSTSVAVEILIDYNEALEIYGDDIDTAYRAALARATASDEWQDYIATAEYKANVEAAAVHNIDADELNAILGAVGGAFEDSLGELIGALAPVLGITDDVIDPTSPNYDESKASLNNILQSVISIINENLTVDVLENFLYGLLAVPASGSTPENPVYDVPATVEKLSGLLGAASKDYSEYTSIPEYLAEAIGGLVGGIGLSFNPDGEYNTLEDILMELLGNFGYESPYNKPVYDFFLEEDVVLANYGRALYEGTVHGSFVNSALIGSSLGGKFPSDVAYGLADLYQLRTDLSYMPELLPILTVRNEMIIFSAIVVLSLIATNFFAKKEEQAKEDK